MNKIRISILALIPLLWGVAVAEVQLDLYLLVGQSNMAGRGAVEAQDQRKPDRVYTLNKENKWVPAVDPIHFDKKIAGVGPGRSFGIEMAKQSKTSIIGLIPCAVGGTSIRKWTPGYKDAKTGAHPYDDMVARLQVALKSGRVKGILWHQGEADAKMGERGTYEAALEELIQRVRTECGDSKVPFVIGQLGEFAVKPWSEGRRAVDAAQQRVAEKSSTVGFASAKGLTDKDGTHFDGPGARELGKRFAAVMIDVQEANSADLQEVAP